MKISVFLAVWLMSFFEPISAFCKVNSPAICEMDSSLIRSFYESEDYEFRIADTQTIPDMGNNQYTVSWYVDTAWWDFDPQTNHIFSKIEFKRGDTVMASFCDDGGWSYIAVENSKAKMFKSFRVDEDHTAVVFRGGAYAAGVPLLTVCILSEDEVKLIFNKEYFIEKIEGGKIYIKPDADKPVCGYLSFLDGHVTVVSDKYPAGKVIF